MDATDHGRVVLSAIIPGRRDLLDKAMQHLMPSHFVDSTQRNLFILLNRYAEVTGSVMTRDALEDMLRSTGADAGKKALYVETYDAIHALASDAAAFRWSIDQIRELSADRATIEAFTSGMEILRTGATDDRGALLKGHAAARTHVLEAFADIDRDLSMQESPEGDMRREGEDMMADYAERKTLHTQGRARGVLFGVSELDFKTGGMQNGELALLAGYAADGKTSMCVQAAWSSAVEQGLNVVFFTTETLRPQVRRKLVARHSKAPQFGLPDGLNTRDLRNGTLDEYGEGKLKEVIDDFTRNPSYGRLHIAQVPRGATISTLEQRMYRIQREFEINFVVMDYLRLLRSDRKRQSDREELGAIIVESKQVVTTFDDGRGVPLLSPWQVNRSSRDEAERIGYYTSKALAETAETTNTADLVVSIMAPADNESRYAEVKAQVLKNRDGETAMSIMMDVDYATATFSSKKRASGSMDQLLGGAEESGDEGEYTGLLSV